MYGCGDAALVKKRTNRNPFKRTIPYELACPEMKDLLHWCGPDLFDVSQVPWKLHTTLSSSSSSSSIKSSSSSSQSKNLDTLSTKNISPKSQSNEMKVGKTVGGNKSNGGSSKFGGDAITDPVSSGGFNSVSGSGSSGGNKKMTTSRSEERDGHIPSTLEKKREYDRKRLKTSS